MQNNNLQASEKNLPEIVHSDPRRYIIIQSSEVQEFYLKTNKLLEKARANPFTSPLLEPLLQLLRKHCELLLPMTTGIYRPHGTYSLNGESASKESNWLNNKSRAVGASENYEPTHLATHTVPHIVEYLIELLNHDFFSLPAAFINFIPILGLLGSGGIKLLEIWKEHQVIHEIQNQLRKLTSYDAALREALYNFVTARTLLAMLPLLQAGEKVGKVVSVLLFSQLLNTLSKLKMTFSIEGFALQWSQHVINQFIMHNLLLPTTNDTENIIALKKRFDTVLTEDELPSSTWFQTIFYWDYQPKTIVNYKEKEIAHPLLHLIYTKFLCSYAHRVTIGNGWSFFYTKEDLKNLRIHYVKLDTALNFIQKSLFEFNSSKEYGALLLHFNIMILNILCAMTKVIPWTKSLKKEAIDLYRSKVLPQTFFAKKESKTPDSNLDHILKVNNKNVCLDDFQPSI